MTHALIIKQPYLNLILSGKKTWELRGSNTKIRGTILLIQSGSGLILGQADLINSLKLTKQDFLNNKHKHCSTSSDTSYKQTYAWVLKNAKHFKKPIPYQHPQGAVIWVKIEQFNSFLY